MTKGQKRHVRSPSGIVNVEHHDPSGARKVILGTPSGVQQVIADATSEVSVQQVSVLRVHNTDAAVQYIWVGEENAVPGTVDATTGIPIPAGAIENFYVGDSTSEYGMVVKTSSANVDIVELIS